MTDRLKGKRIIITGGVNNIGKEAVKAFIAEGATVVVGDIDAERGARVEAEFPGKATFIRVDVTKEEQVQALIEGGVTRLGGLDVLAQNAGLQYSGNVTDFPADRWNALFAVNARAHFFGAKYAVPHLRKAGGGSIINTASLAGQRGGPGMTAYSASKGAVIAFGTALALEVAQDKIRVNTICPGWVDTTFNQPAIDFMGGRKVQEDVVRAIVPLQRQARAHEIAPMFVYLASDESSYMTAQAITIDGGVYN